MPPVDKPDPGCRPEAGEFVPVIDRNRCEGKKDCVAICPYDVFTIATVPEHVRKGLTLRGKLKGFAHGWQQAFATNAAACHACGLCVASCPERAITLARV